MKWSLAKVQHSIRGGIPFTRYRTSILGKSVWVNHFSDGRIQLRSDELRFIQIGTSNGEKGGYVEFQAEPLPETVESEK